MSEFRIVKCKSCAASLVELQGEKINKCVQCGFNFAQKVNKKAKLESVVELAFEKQAQKYDQPNQTSQSNSQTNSPTSSKTKNKPQTQGVKPKNPASVIGTIIKWYIILFIGSKVLRQFL